ncbi:4-hydroxybenzoate octaprenyltransferase [Halomonas elongata]|uniref:4-hydroxybenzoate octaprenyltransferase n=1 Tax=Halomonas elongata TaxID=2746 RepID=A0A1B8NZC0_HALEL|nr:4-hydroxybenzoate octaprenyltransferase [Halomonas elongata]
MSTPAALSTPDEASGRAASMRENLMDSSLMRPSGLARLPDFLHLTRLDRPIGTWLLMWPTLWALWMAAQGVPERKIVLVFVIGVYLMRAAGCVVNDYADRHFDGHVKRTRNRPLATGRISEREAKGLFVILVLLAFALVWLTNPFTVMLSFGGVFLAFIYPFMKRYTHLPRYSWGRPFPGAFPWHSARCSATFPPKPGCCWRPMWPGPWPMTPNMPWSTGTMT